MPYEPEQRAGEIFGEQFELQTGSEGISLRVSGAIEEGDQPEGSCPSGQREHVPGGGPDTPTVTGHPMGSSILPMAMCP